MNRELIESYQHSIEIIRENSASFYSALKSLPRKKFFEVSSIYAFCRICDDMVDEPEDRDAAKKSLELLESQLKSYYRGESPSLDYGWWEGFKSTVETYGIEIDPFLMQIEGQKMDLMKVEILTLEDLIRYSELVAGSVALMLAKVLAEDPVKSGDKEFLGACIDLGIGMQITNILRDVGEDLMRRNRIYLPRTLLQKYGLTKEDLLLIAENEKSEKFQAFTRLWEEMAKISEMYYEKIKYKIFDFDPSVAKSVYACAVIYKEILEEVRKNGYNCLTQRNYTNALTRVKLIREVNDIFKEAKRKKI